VYYVYVIQSECGERYTGYTADLRRRLEAHNCGLNESTKGKKWALVYYEAYRSAEDAKDRERGLKVSGQARRWLSERTKRSSATPSRES